jgi:hypothetical protein
MKTRTGLNKTFPNISRSDVYYSASVSVVDVHFTERTYIGYVQAHEIRLVDQTLQNDRIMTYLVYVESEIFVAFCGFENTISQ